ncbi:MAG: SLC13 family permease [Candidatus Helarchaeota archaeon]
MLAPILTFTIFVIVIILIATEKMNRAVASISGAIFLFIFLYIYPQNNLEMISSFTFSELKEINNLILLALDLPLDQKVFLFFYQKGFFSQFGFQKLMNFMFGSESENFNNLHSIILILGIMIQVHICQEAGVFQFIALKLIKGSAGNPKILLLYCCFLAVFISAVLNNILAIIILIPLTIMICRMLNINPVPYIISEAILVNIGGIMFLISSVPNILISQAAGFNFLDYLINIAWFSLILMVISYLIFEKYFKKELNPPEDRLINVLEYFNPWKFVPDRQLFYKALFSLAITISLIVVFPDFPDTVAISISFILIIISKLKAKQVIEHVDFELILYLLGIFIITGCMEYVGVMEAVGFALKNITGGNPLITSQTILWLSALLSSGIDNIPVTTTLLPIMPILTLGFNSLNTQLSYFALGLGCNLGESLAPIGGNLIVINLAKQNGVNIQFKNFLRIGVITALIQITLTSLYLMTRLTLGY